MTATHQANNPCPSCGSFYRNVDKCNICGIKIEDIEEEKPLFHRENVGRQWSKKRHRYLTQDEIKNGEHGG
jgi:hypothetical protein